MNGRGAARIQPDETMMPRSLARLALWLGLFAAGVYAQNVPLQPAAPPGERVPTVTFAFEMPGADPPHYTVAVASTSRASFSATYNSVEKTGEPYVVKFDITSGTATRIFELARDLNFFQGDFEYRNGRIANMGMKTLRYADGTRKYETSFNYSVNPQMQELTRIFQGMANSLEFGRRLAYLLHYDKLGLDAELKSMEEQAKSKSLLELQVNQDILRRIANDHSIMNITRRRADRLLQGTGNGSGQQARQ
jgi:hypothetical protein